MKLLITGGSGFIGSHFICYWLARYPQDSIVNIDLLTYAGNQENLKDVTGVYGNRYTFLHGDIADATFVESVFTKHRPEVVVNFAAESHNSLAIIDPGRFFRTNVLGTQTLLEASRKSGVERFQHISTCEVYGDLPLDSSDIFNEFSPCRPRTPYNASKAGADHAVLAYHQTFHLPTTISRCCNNYGPFQFPEKVIPLFITNALNRQRLPLYESSQNKREWIFVTDHCRAIEMMIHSGEVGGIYYNVGTGLEKSIEDIADAILSAFGLSHQMKMYIPDRPGHDRRYLLDSSKISRELGWTPSTTFESGLSKTIQWYSENQLYWQTLKHRAPVKEGEWS